MRQITEGLYELKIVTDITTRNSEQIKTNNRTPQQNPENMRNTLKPFLCDLPKQH
jgi:SMC interacting uncharacterized protein involved in chromosome segregation